MMKIFKKCLFLFIVIFMFIPNVNAQIDNRSKASTICIYGDPDVGEFYEMKLNYGVEMAGKDYLGGQFNFYKLNNNVPNYYFKYVYMWNADALKTIINWSVPVDGDDFTMVNHLEKNIANALSGDFQSVCPGQITIIDDKSISNKKDAYSIYGCTAEGAKCTNLYVYFNDNNLFDEKKYNIYLLPLYTSATVTNFNNLASEEYDYTTPNNKIKEDIKTICDKSSKTYEKSKCDVLQAKALAYNIHGQETGDVPQEKPDNGENGSGGGDFNPGTDNGGKFSCETLLGKPIVDFLNGVFLLIKIAGPILCIILSMVDYIKAITGKDDDALKKANKHLVLRLVIVLAIFMLPTLVNAILPLILGSNSGSCGIH